MLTGTLDSSSIVVATVLVAGGGFLPLEPVLRLLRTYKKGVKITLKAEPGFFWLDKMKFTLG